MNGQIVIESQVEWKRNYGYTGRSYESATSGGQSAVGTANPAAAPKSVDRGFSTVKGSENEKPKALVVVPNDDEDEEFDAYSGTSLRDLAGNSVETRDIVAMVFSGSKDGLTEEEYNNWERTGNIFGNGENILDPDEGDPEMEQPDANSDQQFFTMTHDGDYATYTTLSILMASLRWHSGLVGEDHLVGPEEGEVRWVNHFGDIGALSDDGSEEYSWVKDEGEFQLYESHVPSFVREGVTKLRQLVGS